MEHTGDVERPSESANWKESVICHLRDRNKAQTRPFENLVALHNLTFDGVNALRVENRRLSTANQKLRCKGPAANPDRTVKAKLLAQADELADLLRRKNDDAQRIIDLNEDLFRLSRETREKEANLAENDKANERLRVTIAVHSTKIRRMERAQRSLSGEYKALQASVASVEEQIRQVEEENRALVDRFMEYNAKEAEMMNEENDEFARIVINKRIVPSSNARKLGRNVDAGKGSLRVRASPPTRVLAKFVAHEGEASSVGWSPTGQVVATAGADRRIRLWAVRDGKLESETSPLVLVGSNAPVNSLDFDPAGQLVVGSSSDFAARVWSASESRLRHSLVGHCGKVMAARFLDESCRVATGGHDRSLKLWDLYGGACTATRFTDSNCNDLVVDGSTVISGHSDRRLRRWDMRTDRASGDVAALRGEITSLDLSRDFNYLLCCARDDTLRLVDLRVGKVANTFANDGFKVGSGWARAAMSPDGRYAAAGSSNGSVFVWSVVADRLEALLEDRTDAAVTAVSWCRRGNYLATVDKAMYSTIWS